MSSLFDCAGAGGLALGQVPATTLVAVRGGQVCVAHRTLLLVLPQTTTHATTLPLDDKGVVDSVSDAFEERSREVKLCPPRKIRLHRIPSVKRSSIIHNLPSDLRAHLLCVRLPDGEALLPFQDAVEL